MLRKKQDPLFIKNIRLGAKVLLVAEGILFAVSYGIWYRMNTSRDFRLYMHNNYSSILEGYYKLGETLSSDSRPISIRQLDLQLPSNYSVNNSESFKKRQAIVEALRRAAEDKEPMYRQTKEQIDARRAEDPTKKKP
ncbi:hypothetical protein L9F63_014141 [Diploptera punctata]|uniref:Uncharacterized protein n=1 Tax=Diploptera punctata TaxID=6984 RepID=A0AAD8ELD0_DIPPU|nr:hypothetical protein L9F63_014141 [Diploptera punctata]